MVVVGGWVDQVILELFPNPDNSVILVSVRYQGMLAPRSHRCVLCSRARCPQGQLRSDLGL